MFRDALDRGFNEGGVEDDEWDEVRSWTLGATGSVDRRCPGTVNDKGGPGEGSLDVQSEGVREDQKCVSSGRDTPEGTGAIIVTLGSGGGRVGGSGQGEFGEVTKEVV